MSQCLVQDKKKREEAQKLADRQVRVRWSVFLILKLWSTQQVYECIQLSQTGSLTLTTLPGVRNCCNTTITGVACR